MYLYFNKVIIIVSLLTSCQASLVKEGDNTRLLTIDQLAFSPDSHSLAYTASFSRPPYNKFDTTVGQWRLKSGKVKNVTKMMNHKINTIFFSPDGKDLALMYHANYKTNYGFIWNIDRNEVSEKQSYMPDYLGPDSIVAVSPDKKFTAQPDQKGRIRLWNNVTKKIIKTYQSEHIETINVMQFTADSKGLVVVGQAPSYYHYNTRDDEYRGPTVVVSFDLSGKSENVVLDTKSTFLNFQKKANRLLTNKRNPIEIWDIYKQMLIQKINYVGDIKHIQLSNNGRFLVAVISSDLIILPDNKPIEIENRHVVVIWSIKEGLPFHVLTDGTGETTSLAISPNNKTLATGDDNGVIQLWNMKTGKMIKHLVVQGLKQ